MSREPFVPFSKQEQVYAHFRANAHELEEQGTLVDPTIKQEVGAILVFLRLDYRSMQRIEDFSRQINDQVPSIVYGRPNSHCTVGAISARDRFALNREDRMLMDQIKETISPTAARLQRLMEEARYTINEFLYSRTSVIGAGIANQAVREIIQAIHSNCLNHEIPLTPPWGAHTTVARFGEAVEPESLDGLLQTLQNYPMLADCSVASLEVGYCTTDSRRGFSLHPYADIIHV